MINLDRFKQFRRLSYLAILAGFALFWIFSSKMVRRTFVFYTYDRGGVSVEDRMLPKTGVPERDIARYVEEALLGPVSLDLSPLVTKGTKLRSFMLRGGTVYADLSEDAALPVDGAKTDVFTGLAALNRGIRRNFPSVSDVKLFIDGNEVFFKEFADIFVN